VAKLLLWAGARALSRTRRRLLLAQRSALATARWSAGTRRKQELPTGGIRDAFVVKVQPVPPIVVIDDDDFTFYESVDALVADIEPWYPSSVEYLAFDCEGRQVELWADPPIRKRRLIGPIWTDNAHESNLLVRATESVPMHAEELARLLRETVLAGGTPANVVRDWNLKDLLRAAIARHGMT
jgi:hypothetical protein